MELNVKEEMKEGEENWFLHLFSVLFRGSLLLLLAFALAHSTDEFIEILLVVFLFHPEDENYEFFFYDKSASERESD